MPQNSLKGKVVFITGASRGIGREIALRCASEGAMIVIVAKSGEPNPALPGTVYSVAKEVEAAGGKALPLVVDVRDEASVREAVAKAVETFGGIDVLINNASAISMTPTLETTMKKFDLIFSVNVRATFLVSQACIPFLKKSTNPHIVTLSPPLNMQAQWFKNHVAYTMSKYGMSMCTLGMAEEFKKDGIAVNSLWPKTTIATAAIEKNFPPEIYLASRKPSIMADAVHVIITSDSKTVTGRFLVDEEVLTEHGVTDFSQYALDPTKRLCPDLFLN